MPQQFLAVLLRRGRLAEHPSGRRIHECSPVHRRRPSQHAAPARTSGIILRRCCRCAVSLFVADSSDAVPTSNCSQMHTG